MVAVRAAGPVSVKLFVILAALMLLAGMLGRQFGRKGSAVDHKKKRPAVEAARKCPACGAYAMDGARCEREDCPVD